MDSPVSCPLFGFRFSWVLCPFQSSTSVLFASYGSLCLSRWRGCLFMNLWALARLDLTRKVRSRPPYPSFSVGTSIHPRNGIRALGQDSPHDPRRRPFGAAAVDSRSTRPFGAMDQVPCDRRPREPYASSPAPAPTRILPREMEMDLLKGHSLSATAGSAHAGSGYHNNTTDLQGGCKRRRVTTTLGQRPVTPLRTGRPVRAHVLGAGTGPAGPAIPVATLACLALCGRAPSQRAWSRGSEGVA